MSHLTTPGRRARVLCTLVVLLLATAGTLWGEDDLFPFAPMKMFSTAPDPDGDAKDTRVEGVDVTGRTVPLTEHNTGIRRAEIEGQEQAYRDDPGRLIRIAEAYSQHTPGAPALREVRIVVRWHDVENSRPTGRWRDETIADWTRP